MPDDLDKQRIRQRFARSLDTYADAATVQRTMAHDLLRDLLRVADGQRTFPRIAEAGCGTGLLTDLIERHLDYQQLILIDLVPDCARLHQHRPRATFIPGDLETLTLPTHLDLFLANAVLQWIRDLPRLLQRLADALKPGALLAVTSFGPQNLREIAALTGRGLHYHDLQTWQRLLQPHFSLLHADEHLHQLPFHSPLDVLRHLRQTGVTATASSSTPPWTRTQLNDFSQRYRQRFRLPDGDLPLTYHPLTLIARRLPN